jgi:opacity protein-like surface antigen
MKKYRKLLFSFIILKICSVSLAHGSTPLAAGKTNSLFYVSTDAGLNLASRLKVPGVTYAGVSYSGPVIHLAPGFRYDLSAGYLFKLSDQLNLDSELETGFIYNNFSDYSEHYIQVPLMANAVISWHFSPDWSVFAGGGVGCDYSLLSTSIINGYVIRPDNENTELDFAWQAMAEIRYQFGSSEIGLGYKYLAVQPFGWDTVGNNTIFFPYLFHF